MPIPDRKTGFTLIELSIVLVIIGLVVGGVMVGRDLIKQAAIKKNYSQLQQLELAYRTFKLKYGCVAGDCKDATDLFGNYIPVAGSCTMPNGNGNGNGDDLINDGGTGNWYCESRQTVYSLVAANMLPATSVTSCGSTYFKGINDKCAYFSFDDVYLELTPKRNKNTVTFADFSAPWAKFPALSPNEARAIDEKIDDGISNKGRFSGLDAADISAGTGAIVVGSCVTSGAYNNNDVLSCRAVYYLD